MEQVVSRPNGTQVRTTRCPVRIDGRRLFNERAAPTLGDANEKLEREVFEDRQAGLVEAGADGEPLAR